MIVKLTSQGEAWIGLRGGVMALGLVGVVLVLVRRKFPLTSVVGLAALMGVQPAVALLTAVATYAATRHQERARRRAGLLLVATVSAMVTCGACAPELGLGSRPFGVALGAVLAVTTVVVPGLVGAAAGQQDRLLRALRERAAAAEETRRIAERESRMCERSRIAAEMHDLVGHRLSLVSLRAGGLEMALCKEAPELRDGAALVRRAAREAMRELREALGVLAPLGGRDAGTGALTDATGTRADIEALVEESRGGGIPVELAWEGPDLAARPSRVRRAVHRLVRESLTNVHRHAAGARVTVDIRHGDERVAVEVRNGVPPTTPTSVTGVGSGRGLIGLRERVSLLGGVLEAGRTPGGGFAVVADFPADPETSADVAETMPYGTGRSRIEGEPGGGISVLQRRVAGAASGLLGLAGVGLMMLFGVALVASAQPENDHRSYEKPRVGMAREQVDRVVAGDVDAVRAAAAGREPPRPRSATDCRYPSTGAAKGGRLEIVRYCFRSDVLIAIDRFAVPLVTEPVTGVSQGSRTHD
ncbi:sensor histidine kinase [Streptomyces noursei]